MSRSLRAALALLVMAIATWLEFRFVRNFIWYPGIADRPTYLGAAVVTLYGYIIAWRLWRFSPTVGTTTPALLSERALVAVALLLALLSVVFAYAAWVLLTSAPLPGDRPFWVPALLAVSALVVAGATARLAYVRHLSSRRAQTRLSNRGHR